MATATTHAARPVPASVPAYGDHAALACTIGCRANESRTCRKPSDNRFAARRTCASSPGAGRYSDDLNLPGQAYAFVLRSPHAHARIRKIDTAAARAMPGVLAVLTGADVKADGPEGRAAHADPDEAAGRHPADQPRRLRRTATRRRSCCRPTGSAMSASRWRWWWRRRSRRPRTPPSGSPSTTRRSIRSARRRPRRKARAPQALRPRRQRLHRRRCRRRRGDQGGVRPRRACGEVRELGASRHRRAARRPRRGRRLRQGDQQVHACTPAPAAWCGRSTSSPQILGVEQRDVRVECGDVGGNFGTRNAFYPEFALVVWAAKQLGRPVKWTCERSEAFASDYQGRDQAITLELALDERGKFLALRGSVVCNTGAHSVMYVPLVKCAELLTSIYRIPAAHIRARAALTNTPPTNPYRSAGRPEAIFAIERLIDVAAQGVRLRPHRSAPPQHHPAQGAALRQSARHDLRLRRLRQGDGPGAGAVGLEGLQEAPPRVEEERQAARHRACELSGDHQRLAARMVEGRREAGGPRRGLDRHAVERPGPRDELRAMRRRMARRRCRAHQARSRATPTSCRSAAARIRRARCGWAASSWARRRRR